LLLAATTLAKFVRRDFGSGEGSGGFEIIDVVQPHRDTGAECVASTVRWLHWPG